MKLTGNRQLLGWSGILALVLVALSVAAGAASSVNMASPDAAFSAYGELLAVQGRSITLQTTDGQTLNISVEPWATVIVGRNRNASLDDLQAGQWVRARVLQDQAGQLSSAFVRKAPARPSAPAQGSKAVSKTAAARGSKAAVQATAAPRVCGQPGGNQSTGDWPMLGQDAAHGFYNAGELHLAPPLTVGWELDGEWNISSPAVVGDVAYVGAYDGFHALDLQAHLEVWVQSGLNSDNEFSSPAVVNGVIYFGTWTGDVYALDANTGQIVWHKSIIPAGDWAQIYSPAVVGGVVYLTADRWPAAGGSATTVYALDAATGNVSWSTDAVTITGWDNATSDPVVANGIVYVGTSKYGVYALDAGTGSVLWNFSMPAGAAWSDINFDGYVVVQNGLVYVPFTFGASPNFNDILYALDATAGSVVWTYDPVWPEQFSSSVLVHGGSAYVMMEKPGDSQFAYLVELNALTGQEVGRLEQVDDGTDGGWFWLSAANGAIYTTSAGLTVRAYDLSYGGADVWSYQTLFSIEVPATPASGRLVVVDEWPRLYVFDSAGQQGGICGGVYEDTNENGAWNLGELGISGATVKLSGPAAQSAATDGDGIYSFTPLDPGAYTVTETDPPGYASVSANPGSTGGTATDLNTIAGIPLPAGSSSTDNDFGDVVGCGLEVFKTCLVEPPPATDLLCQAGIAATTLRYTGADHIADATVVFQGKDNGSATYSNVELIPGETALTDPGQSGWTIDGTPKLGSRTTIVITDNATGNTYEEIIHTSCSAIYEAGSPAPLDGNTPNPPNSAKGDPSPTWFVESFIDKNGSTVVVPAPSAPSATCEIVPQPAPSCGTGEHEDGEHGDGHGSEETKPYSLTLRYTGADCSASNNSQDPKKAKCTDLGVLTAPAFILVTDKKNVNDHHAKVFFSGDVNVGQTFEVEASNAGESKLKSQTYYYIFDQEGGTLLQSGTFHTSCSQPLEVGDVFGSLTLEGINGQGITGNAVTYGYTVTNTGSSPITAISLVDDKLGPIAGPFDLDGGESATFEALAEILETTTNVATVTGQAGTRQCTANASAMVTVVEPPSPECIVEGDDELEIHDKKVEWELENEGGDTITIDSITIQWPADLGDLKKVKLDDKTIYDHALAPASATIDSGWKGSTRDREIEAGEDAKLRFEFEHEADTNEDDYAITVHFAEGCSVEFTPEPSETPTETPEPSETPTETPEPSETPTVTPESSETPEPSETPTVTPEPPGGDECEVSAGELDFHDKEVRWEITNGGSDPATITTISVSWPGHNGKLREVKLDGERIFREDRDPPSTAIDSGWEGGAERRTIGPDETKTLKFRFKHDVSDHPDDYTIRVEFGDGCSVEHTGTSGGSSPFQCKKPIDQMTMIWDGATGPIGVNAWKDNPGEDLLATFDNVQVGQAVIVAGYAPKRGNDVIWEIFETNVNGAKIGESTFHLSCSDRDMDGPEDCGKREGDGKGRSGYINDWILEGMVDSQTNFTCSTP